MAQISRPFQIALVVVVLVAGVWLFVLHGSSNTTNTPTTASSSPVITSSVSPGSTPSAHHPTSTHAAGTSAHEGHTHGLGGLSHAIEAAHKAAAVSKHNATELESKSRQASGETAKAPSSPGHSTSTAAAATHAGTTTTHAASTTHATTAPATKTKTTVTPHSTTATLATPTGQREVEGELKQGKIAVLLFWSPAGADDKVVHNELQLLLKLHSAAHNAKAKAKEFRRAEKFFGLELDKQIAVHEAHANQVADYGTITRGVQIYGTPTLLVINPKGLVITITGITDAYSIEQAIEEARTDD
jgi:hypothetical protein